MQTSLSLEDVFANLTQKQRETIELLAEGHTSKEIAFQLGISESAAVQRIETLRMKCGGLLRKDMAREYRNYAPSGRPAPETCNDLTGKTFQLPDDHKVADIGNRQHPEAEMQLSDSMPFSIDSRWACDTEPRVVPEVLDGRNAGLNRWLAATVLAMLIGVLMLVLFSVAGEIRDLI